MENSPNVDPVPHDTLNNSRHAPYNMTIDAVIARMFMIRLLENGGFIYKFLFDSDITLFFCLNLVPLGADIAHTFDQPCRFQEFVFGPLRPLFGAAQGRAIIVI